MNYRLAKNAYDTYVETYMKAYVKEFGKSLTPDDTLPKFETLQESVKDAWATAAEAVRVNVVGTYV